jgi:hypothetical protein
MVLGWSSSKTDGAGGRWPGFVKLVAVSEAGFYKFLKRPEKS